MSDSHFVQLGDISSHFSLLLFHQGRFLCSDEGLFWDASISAQLQGLSMPLLRLGEHQGRQCLGAVLDETHASNIVCEQISARRLLTEIAYDGVDFATSANQLLHWIENHKFCGLCGEKNTFHPHERALRCPRCETNLYPRINPCVIVLVTKGDKMLLARNAASTFPFFSCLAGFMEVGETPEETVAREVREEVGIEIGNIRYFKSQSWPFPSQLMIGFFADYVSGDICVDGIEIAEAHWFDKGNRPERPKLNRPIQSVASDLVSHFLSLQNS
jgi:NAD+ diphosphatase